VKHVRRAQCRSLIRRSYMLHRIIRIRPVKLNFTSRPVRFGVKPQINTVL